MAAGQSQIIQTDDFTTIRNKVVEIFGVGVGDSGYGQVSSVASLPQLTVGSVITLNYWLALRSDMVKSRQHQTGITVQSRGPNDVGYVAGQDLITPGQGNYLVLTEEIRKQYSDFANILVTNRFEVHPSQLIEINSIPSRTRSTAWNSTITHYITFTGFSNKTDPGERIIEQANNIRHFFNAGGSIKLTSSRGGGADTPKNTAWTNLLSGMGEVRINYTGTTNLNSTIPTTPFETRGWYDLTEEYQTMFEAGSVTDKIYRVSAKRDADLTQMLLKIEFQDINTDIPDINVDGILTSTVSYFKPSGSNVDVPGLIVTQTGLDEPVAPDPDIAPPTVEAIAISSNAGADKTYTTDDVVTVEVTFSEPVTVSTVLGTPKVLLNVGEVTKDAMFSYTSSNKAYFNYTVLSGDTDPDGVRVDANSIQFNGGYISDLAGNTAILTHPAIADNPNHLVDTTPPIYDSAYYSYESDTDLNPTAEFNIMFIVDTSGSMGDNTTFDNTTTTRLDAAKTAMNYILDKYALNAAPGAVAVRIINYSSSAAAIGSSWTSIAVAKTQIDALRRSGGTTASAALTAAISAFSSSGKLLNGRNICYFITDAYKSGHVTINSTQETTWKNFLNSNKVVSYAMGVSTTTVVSDLNPIAWNGATGEELNGLAINETLDLDSYILTYQYLPIIVPSPLTVNVMLIVDVSGSMRNTNTIYNATSMRRLAAAKVAANYILDEYENRGDAVVRIVKYAGTATQIGNTWYNIATAKTVVDSLDLTGITDGTNPATALTVAQSAFTTNGKFTGAGVRNVCYFITDAYRDPVVDRDHDYDKHGNITYLRNHFNVSSTVEQNWVSFLQANRIISYAFGIDTNTYPSSLDPVAYDGETVVTQIDNDDPGTIVTGINLRGLKAVTNPELDPIILSASYTVIPTPDDPTLVKSGAIVTGNQLTIRYADTSLLDETNIPDPADFVVRLLRSEVSSVLGVDSVTVDGTGKFVTLELESPVQFGDSVTVSYTKQNSTKAIQDIVGNDAANLVDEYVINATLELVYSKLKFTESSANNGSITETATITIKGNGSFNNSGGLVPGVTFTNVPAGLTPVLTRTSAKVATLSFTGTATLHEELNSVNNIEILFTNNSFIGGITASTVTNYNRTDLSIDFINTGYNLILILDTSGSTVNNTTYNGNVVSYFSAEQTAALYTLGKYVDKGIATVCIMGVNNQDTSSTKYKWTTSIDEAERLILNIRSGSITGWSSGTVSQAWTAGYNTNAPSGAVYYFSDSTHSQSISSSIFGFNTSTATWTNFLDTNGIYALGVSIGAGSKQDSTNINRISWDGRTSSDISGIQIVNDTGLDSYII